MNTSHIPLRASLSALLLTLIALMVLAVFETPAKPLRGGRSFAPAVAAVVRPQNQKRTNIEKLNDEKDASPPKNTKSNKADATTKPFRSRSRKERDSSSTSRGLPSEYALTFVCSQPGTDIFVDGVRLGTSGEDGRLKVKLAPGRHIAKASRPQFRDLTKPIEIGPGLTEIGFNLEPVPAIKPVSAPTPAPVEPPAKPAPPAADTIIERFLDNSQNASITTADWKEVVSQSEKALAQEPGNAQTKSRMLFAHGQLAYKDSEYAIALVAFNEAAKAKPDFGPAYYGSGNAYLLNNLLPEAIKSYQQAILLLPNFALAHKGLGDALAKMGNRKDALASYHRARQLGYPGTDLTLAIARNLIIDQQWTRALEELKPVAEQNPSAQLLVAIGECYEGLKNNFSAALTYTKATELDRNSAEGFYRLGSILHSMREYGPAKEALDRAIMLDPRGEKINLIDARKKAQESSSKPRK